MSSGNSVTSPPPSPGPKYKLAEHRYGKEEMLALFSEDVKIPEELAMFESICRSRPVLPLAFQPLTEEEQVLLSVLLKLYDSQVSVREPMGPELQVSVLVRHLSYLGVG